MAVVASEAKNRRPATAAADNFATASSSPSAFAPIASRMWSSASTEIDDATADKMRETYSSAAAALGCWRTRRTKLLAAALALVVLFVWLGTGTGSLRPAAHNFVSVNGTQVAGFNAHDAIEMASIKTSDFVTVEGRAGKDILRDAFRNASRAGLNTVRVFAHATSAAFPIQGGPGDVDYRALLGLDFVIAEAQAQGLKVLLSLADNWKYGGGVDQYVDWSPTTPERGAEHPRPPDEEGDTDNTKDDPRQQEYEAERHALFFTDPNCREFYKEYVKRLVLRRNRLTGRLYYNDDTIMAWGLLNEPRCELYKTPDCATHFHSWVSEMAAFVKQLAPKQLLTIGAEGFFDADSAHVGANPGDWATLSGQSFMKNQAVPEIDFTTAHAWPDNWRGYTTSDLEKWIAAHVSEAQQLKKPLLLEEFGKKLAPSASEAEVEKGLAEGRNEIYHSVFHMVERSIDTGQALQGSLFWRLDVPVYRKELWPGPYPVRPEHSTWGIISEHAARLRNISVTAAPNPRCMAQHKLQCFVLQSRGPIRRCVKRPEACLDGGSSHSLAAIAEENEGRSVSQQGGSRVATWVTREACCREAHGRCFPV